MRVTRFEAENFGPHAHLAVDFRPGLNVVVGRNGSGKSTLVDGLYAALTGEFPGEGSQADHVRQTAPKRAVSRVIAELTHAGTALSITRRLAPSPGRELTAGGERVGRTADEVNDALWSRLGVTRAVLTDYAFVRQWEAFGVLTATPAKRLQALNRLFGVDQVDRAYAALDARVSGLAAHVTVPPERLHEAERRAAEASARLLQAEQRLDALWDAAACDRLIADYVTRSRDRDSRRSWEEQLALLVGQADRTTQDRDRLVAETERLLVEYENGVVLYNALHVVRQNVDADARAWSEYDRRKAECDRAAADRQARQAEADRLKVELDAAPVVTDEFLAETESKLEAARVELATSEKAVRDHQVAGGDTCPTCRSPITPEYRRWFEQVQEDLITHRARAEAAGTAAYGIEQEILLRRQAEQTYERALDRVRGVVQPEAPVAPARPRPAPEHVTDATRVVNEAWIELSGMRTDKDRAIGQRDGAVREVERLLVELDALTRKLAALPPLPPEVSEADYQRAVADRAERASLQVAVAACRSELSAADADRRACEKLVGEGRRRAEAGARLKELKDVFRPGPGGLASQVVDFCLEALADTVNARLDQFGAPFAVRVDAQAALTALFADGTATPAGRLSGGQKMMLALAFRLSVLSEYGGDLGFLCLDEPTVGLDDVHRAGLTRCLAAAGRWAAAGDSQLIIVTHDAHLAAAADHVVRLG